MIMWILIVVGVLAAVLGGAVCLLVRWSRLIYSKETRKKHKLLTKLLPLAVFLGVAWVVSYCFNSVNGVLIMLHLELFWILWDFACLIFRKIKGRSQQEEESVSKDKTDSRQQVEDIVGQKTGGRQGSGGLNWAIHLMPVFLTVVYFSVGWYFAHHVYETHYDLATEKPVGSLRIVQFADSHVGAVFDADRFADYMDDIQATDPDLVLITGDFVDDDTSKADMLGACQALSRLHPTYGVYYSYGNHDRGYYEEERRGWTSRELADNLLANGVKILQDQVEEIDDRFYIIGREDYSRQEAGVGRLSMEELTQGLDQDKYSIVMDHQPHDYDAQAAAGVDLVLSGHTHGGQLFPAGILGELSGANCKTYGTEQRDKTTFLVTSGIGDWAIKFRTACIAEYVVIDVEGKQ